MDPATWSWLTCTWLIQTSVGGILGNRLDAKATDVWAQGWKAFTHKMRGECPTPINQDLEIAVHRAFLLAQRSLVCDCLEEFTGGTWTELGISDPAVMPGYSIEDVQWLQDQLAQIKADLENLQKGDYTAIPSEALATSEALFQSDQGLVAVNAEGVLRDELKTQVLAAETPKSYRDRAVAEHTGLFERVAAFFAFELKTSEKVQSLFQNQLLVQINSQLQALEKPIVELDKLELQLKDFAQQLPTVITRLESLEIAICDMGSDVLEVSWLMASKIGELMRIATVHSDDLAQIKHSLAKLVAGKPQAQIQSAALVGTTRRNREGPNPFIYGPTVSPERFYGRVRNRRDIKDRIGSIEPQSINIVGLRRNGKSSTLRYIKERIDDFCSPEQKPLVVLLDLQDGRFHQPAGILEGIRRGIAKQLGSEPWARENNNDPFEIEDGLEALKEKGHRLIVMFDEFEAIGQRLEVFHDWGDDWRSKASRSLVTLVLASCQEVSKLYSSLGLTSPFGNIFSTTVLGALEPEAEQSLLDSGGLEAAEIAWVRGIAGGLPYYTQAAASLLWSSQDMESAQRQFSQQVQQRFYELWQKLSQQEQLVLRQGIGGILAQHHPGICEGLRAHGLLKSDSAIFSPAFANFVRRQS